MLRAKSGSGRGCAPCCTAGGSAPAYSDPEFDAAAQAARRARPEDLVPLPGWDDTR